MQTYTVEIRAKLQGALGTPSERRTYEVEALTADLARYKTILRAHSEGLEHVDVLRASAKREG